MLTDDERALYFQLARGCGNAGNVYELGPWLGSGTYQICRGLSESSADWSLTTIDRFTWTQLYENKYKLGLAAGESFLPLFEKHLAEYLPRIRTIRTELGDIESTVRIENEIELLYVDAPKSWRMLRHVLRHFGPHLLPGARLVFQDFLHITSRQLIWLLMSLPMLRIESLVRKGCTATFVVEEKLGDMASLVPQQFEQVSVASLLTLWGKLEKEFPEERLGEMAAGLALDLLEKNAAKEAVAVLDAAAKDNAWTGNVIKQVERLIRPDDPEVGKRLTAISSYLKEGKALQV
jgi:hypothetical protein